MLRKSLMRAYCWLPLGSLAPRASAQEGRDEFISLEMTRSSNPAHRLFFSLSADRLRAIYGRAAQDHR